MHFDTLIKNGQVMDPGGGHTGSFDIAITRNRIAAIEPNIDPAAARKLIDATGQIVTPGLIDLHTHVYHSVTYWGIKPDPIAARSGVTTWLDVGSAGAYNFAGLREFVIKQSEARIYALLNISGIGLTAPNWELLNLNYLDVDLCCKVVDLNRDLVLGIKARIDYGTTGGEIAGLLRARAAADRCELPLMVHIASGPPTIQEILPHLRAGDILTHCCTGRSNKLVADSGQMLSLARQARDAGVLFDVGHGAGSFSFESAESMLAAGFVPDVISTDMHQLAVHGPCFDMPTTLTKFMLMGLSLEECIARATIAPARALKLDHEVGTLNVGALADVALFTLNTGSYTLYDIDMHARTSHQLLTNTLTILGGRPMHRIPDDDPAPWIELDAGQRMMRDRGHVPISR